MQPEFARIEIASQREANTVITIAEGIASSKPTRIREVLAPVRASGGEIVAVAEDEIVRALASLASKGFYVEPTSAAAAAVLSPLIARGVIRHGFLICDQTLRVGAISKHVFSPSVWASAHGSIGRYLRAEDVTARVAAV